MVGGLLIALAALGVFVTTQGDDGPPSTRFLVASVDIEPGGTIRSSDLAEIPIDLPLAQTEHVFTDLAQLDGALAIAPIRAGELINASVVRPAVSGSDAEDKTTAHRRLSVALDLARAVNGDLVAGDRVDLLATSGSGASARTDVLIRDAQVLATDRGDQSRFGTDGRVTVTLAVESGADVLAAVHANEAAIITLVESNRAGDGLPPSFRLPGPDDRVAGTVGGSQLEEAAAGR